MLFEITCMYAIAIVAQLVYTCYVYFIASICLFTGEFGVVYKAHLVKTVSNNPLQSRTVTETIAVKTLKGECVVT